MMLQCILQLNQRLNHTIDIISLRLSALRCQSSARTIHLDTLGRHKAVREVAALSAVLPNHVGQGRLSILAPVGSYSMASTCTEHGPLSNLAPVNSYSEAAHLQDSRTNRHGKYQGLAGVPES